MDILAATKGKFMRWPKTVWTSVQVRPKPELGCLIRDPSNVPVPSLPPTTIFRSRTPWSTMKLPARWTTATLEGSHVGSSPHCLPIVIPRTYIWLEQIHLFLCLGNSIFGGRQTLLSATANNCAVPVCRAQPFRYWDDRISICMRVNYLGFG
ncbi:hypothetical protein B0H16DRAFT_1467627 [Mycena metata]|uniref:Uncharacterized protein n=1 Tax=Mycena metata TaxID=1033252 RepID=A0AAD7MWV1_9AGAR|nr:hypothetical protein B0H16DRAFT_1467627 [Mycena metata]